MKALIATLALLVGTSAQARSPIMHVTHTLPHVVENNQLAPGHVGLIEVNLSKQTIEVKIFNDPCGSLLPHEPGTVTCMAVATLERQYEVPLKKRTTGGCGEAIYSGEKDMRPVDGNLIQIELVDNQNNICESLIAMNRAEVTLLERTAGFGGPVMDLVTKLFTDYPY